MRGAVVMGRGRLLVGLATLAAELVAGSGRGGHFLSCGDGGVALPTRTPREQVRKGWWLVSP